MRRTIPLLLLLSACQPPAADTYLQREAASNRLPQASPPIESPDTSKAIWAPAEREGRILFGVPGQVPMLAMECVGATDAAKVVFTRFVAADRNAQAMMALVGNSHALRLEVDATKSGRTWLWQGSVAADNPDLDALTGTRDVEATVPGAGTLVMGASPLTRELIEACRSKLAPPDATALAAPAS